MADRFNIWCYIEGEHNYFFVSISPGDTVGDLQEQILAKNRNSLEGYDAAHLNLIKVRHIVISTRASME
jgi:hypothetical protein